MSHRVDRSNRRIQVFDVDGRFLRMFTIDVPPPPGTRPVNGNTPTGQAFANAIGAPNSICITPGPNQGGCEGTSRSVRRRCAVSDSHPAKHQSSRSVGLTLSERICIVRTASLRHRSGERGQDMTLRYMSVALTVIVLSCGVLTVDPAHAQTRDASLLPPEQSGVITVAGCLQLGGKNGDRFLLANPKLGPIANVPDETCDATVDDRTLDLQYTAQHGINRSMVGHWVEINGRLEKETDTDLTNLREMEVRSFRMVPVIPRPVIAPRAEAAPAPVPRPQAEQQPVTLP